MWWAEFHYPLVASAFSFVSFKVIAVGSCFATVRFTTIHFYGSCRVGPSIPDLWCVTVATQASFLYLVRVELFSGVHVFLLFLFSCLFLSWLWFFHPLRPSKGQKRRKKLKNSWRYILSWCLLNHGLSLP